MARIKLLRNRKEAQVRQMRREVAQLLEANQDMTARIRVRAFSPSPGSCFLPSGSSLSPFSPRPLVGVGSDAPPSRPLVIAQLTS